MSELLNELITPEMMRAIYLVIAFFVILYILSIIWTARDAYLRGANPVLWGIIAIVPLLGVIAYCMMRPPLYLADREEQSLDVTLRERQLAQYGECPRCGYPVEKNFIVCPHCQTRLRNVCHTCGHALEPAWTVCPYCCTKIGGQEQ